MTFETVGFLVGVVIIVLIGWSLRGTVEPSYDYDDFDSGWDGDE